MSTQDHKYICTYTRCGKEISSLVWNRKQSYIFLLPLTTYFLPYVYISSQIDLVSSYQIFLSVRFPKRICTRGDWGEFESWLQYCGLHLAYFKSITIERATIVNGECCVNLLDSFNHTVKRKRPHLAKENKILYHQDNAHLRRWQNSVSY